MDLTMPDGMDGWTATKAIRDFEESAGIPPARIVALSGSCLPEDVEKDIVAGVDKFQPKPCPLAPFRRDVLKAVEDYPELWRSITSELRAAEVSQPMPAPVVSMNPLDPSSSDARKESDTVDDGDIHVALDHPVVEPSKSSDYSSS